MHDVPHNYLAYNDTKLYMHDVPHKYLAYNNAKLLYA